MLKKLYFILLLFITYSSIAQEVQIEWSPNLPNNKQIIPSGARDGKIYATYLTKEGLFSGLIYGKDMVEEFNAPISINMPSPRTKLEKTIFLKDKIVFVLCDYKNLTHFNVFLASTDYDYKVLSQPIQISSSVVRQAVSYKPTSHNISISPDSNLILFTRVLHPENSKHENAFEYQIFDASLKQLKKQNLNTESSGIKYEFVQSEISNDSNIAVLLLHYTDNNYKIIPHRYNVFLIKNTMTSNVDLTPSIFNINSANTSLSFDNKNNLYFIGLIEERTKGSSVDVGKITQNVNIFKYNFNQMKIDTNYNFSTAVFYSTQSSLRKDEKIKMNLEQIGFNNNDELCIVMAQQENFLDGKYLSTHQGNIGVLILNQDGSPKWHTKIPRLNLKSVEYNKIGIGTDDIYLLRRLPDDHKIITEENKFQHKNKSYKNLGLYMTTIKPNGTILNKKLYNYKDYKYEPDMNNIIFTKPNRFIMNTRFNTGIITID